MTTNMFKVLISGLFAVAVVAPAFAAPTSTEHAGCCGGQCGCMTGGMCAMMGKMDMGAPAKANPPAADQYDGQKTCPVSDKPLGTMGTPIAVEVKGQTIYVCCKGCVAKVKANPDLYLGKVQKEKEQSKKGQDAAK